MDVANGACLHWCIRTPSELPVVIFCRSNQYQHKLQSPRTETSQQPYDIGTRSALFMMCRERKYRCGNCRRVNSYDRLVFITCRNPDNFPNCITNPPDIDEPGPRATATCKSCCPRILPEIMNYAAEVTAHASSAYRAQSRDYVPVPAHLRRWFPRRAPSAAIAEPEEGQPEGAAAGPAEPDDIEAEVAWTYFDESSRGSVHPPSHLHVPQSNSPAPSSSSQRTGVVYMENGHKYPFTVNDSAENPDWVEMVQGEHYIFENDPNLDKEMREEFRPGMESRQRNANYIDGVQKTTSSRRGR